MKSSGTTLVELVVVLAIAAVVMSIAVPGFASLTRSSDLTSSTNELVSSLHLARSEAIKRGARAVVCASADGMGCAAAGGWQRGWLVFHDANNNALRDEGEALIHVRRQLPEGISVTASSPVARYVSYAPTGGSKLVSGAWQFGSLTLCAGTGDSQSGRKVIISSSGRPRTVKLDACPE